MTFNVNNYTELQTGICCTALNAVLKDLLILLSPSIIWSRSLLARHILKLDHSALEKCSKSVIVTAAGLWKKHSRIINLLPGQPCCCWPGRTLRLAVMEFVFVSIVLMGALRFLCQNGPIFRKVPKSLPTGRSWRKPRLFFSPLQRCLLSMLPRETPHLKWDVNEIKP